MGRASTPLETRNSPLKTGKVNSSKNSLFRSVFKPPRSPDGAKPQRSSFKFKPLRQSPYNRPVLAPKNKLYTIAEESPQKEQQVAEERSARDASVETSFYRDLGLAEFSGREDGDESSELDSDFEGWDDENTLVAKFQVCGPELSEREQLANLAHELEGPMKARSEFLKQYLAHTVAPAARKVKEVHNLLEQKVDVAFGVGVLSFDDACKKVEQLSLRDEDDLKMMYMDTQRNVRDLFKQLKEAYQKRDQLWVDLRDAVDKSTSNTLASLSSLPSELDDNIAVIEKKAKEVMKSGGMDGKAKQKLLREIMSEMM